MKNLAVEALELLLFFIPDKLYIELKYRYKVGKRLDWNSIRTFNEKIQWLKIHDRKTEYTKMVDKVSAKKYAEKIIGSKYIIPTIGVWDNCNDISLDALPDKFVIKTSHDSGGVFICKNKSRINWKRIKKEINRRLRRNYYFYGREWPYKNIPRKVIVEELLESKINLDSERISDYKFMTFNGTVKCIFVCTERDSSNGLRVTFFDRQWNELPFERHYRRSDVKIGKPESLQEMISVAERLAEGIPFARIDLYEVDGHVYFGEITLYPGSGFEEFKPDEWDAIMGKWLELPV